MTKKPEMDQRRSLRLKGYDYAQPGAYFITICTHQHQCLFGEIAGAEFAPAQMRLNKLGEIVREKWFRTAALRANIQLFDDEFVIMPNHVHGIIWITDTDNVGAYCNTPPRDAELFQSPSKTIGAIIRGFKSAVTKRINIHRGTPYRPVWQRNYYERIIRDEKEYDQIAAYIISNPDNWEMDQENPGKL